MAGCNQVLIETDYRTLPELDNDLQRFAFDEEHTRLRDNVAIHTIEDSQDIRTFQMIHGKGVRGALPKDFKGVGARYVQTMAIKQGHLSDFLAAVDELSAFHEKSKMSPVTVWAIQR